MASFQKHVGAISSAHAGKMKAVSPDEKFVKGKGPKKWQTTWTICGIAS